MVFSIPQFKEKWIFRSLRIGYIVLGIFSKLFFKLSGYLLKIIYVTLVKIRRVVVDSL